MPNGRNPHLGSTLDELLNEDQMRADAREIAANASLAARSPSDVGRCRTVSKSEMVRRTGTNRSALAPHRDPDGRR